MAMENSEIKESIDNIENKVDKILAKNQTELFKIIAVPLFGALITILVFVLQSNYTENRLSTQMEKKFESERYMLDRRDFIIKLDSVKQEFEKILSLSGNVSISANSGFTKLDKLLESASASQNLYCFLYVPRGDKYIDSIKGFIQYVVEINNKLRIDSLYGYGMKDSIVNMCLSKIETTVNTLHNKH